MKFAAFAVCAALLIAVAQADRDLKLIEIPTNAPVTET
jgi:hypothetical protein